MTLLEILKHFELDKTILHNDFYSDDNKSL